MVKKNGKDGENKNQKKPSDQKFTGYGKDGGEGKGGNKDRINLNAEDINEHGIPKWVFDQAFSDLEETLLAKTYGRMLEMVEDVRYDELWFRGVASMSKISNEIIKRANAKNKAKQVVVDCLHLIKDIETQRVRVMKRTHGHSDKK